MRKKIILLTTIILFTIFNSKSYSQTISREVLIEDTLSQFVNQYNLTQRLIDSTSLTNAPLSEKKLFAQFINSNYHFIFMNNLMGLLNGTISTSMLTSIYNDELNSFLVRKTALLAEFNTWKQTSVHSHTGHNHAEAGCNNVDFELGNYTHWIPSYGDVYCPGTHPPGCIQGITAGTTGAGNAAARHYIVNGGLDPDCPAVTSYFFKKTFSCLLLC